MATLITRCPSCNGPLRIPDDLVGHRVRCPSCQTVFHAAAPEAPVASDAPPEPEKPLWKSLQLELDTGDPTKPDSAPASEPPPRRPGLTGAVEIGLSETGDDAAPKPAPPPGPLPRGALFPTPNERDDSDRGSSRRRRYRRESPWRDSEPHRGALILVLGIISLASIALSLCYGFGTLIGLPLGVTAWVLGSGDLRRIKKHEMDEEGLGMTQAGWTCGIIGTILHSLVLLTCGVGLSVLLISANRPAPARPMFGPPPMVRPPMPPPPPRMAPHPQKIPIPDVK